MDRFQSPGLADESFGPIGGPTDILRREERLFRSREYKFHAGVNWTLDNGDVLRLSG